MTQLKIDNVRLMSNNVLIIKEFESVQKYKETIKIKRVGFETSIVDSFYHFFSKKSMNENVDNSKMEHSFSISSDDLMKTLKKTFRGICSDLNESSSFENDLSPTTFHV